MKVESPLRIYGTKVVICVGVNHNSVIFLSVSTAKTNKNVPTSLFVSSETKSPPICSGFMKPAFYLAVEDGGH